MKILFPTLLGFLTVVFSSFLSGCAAKEAMAPAPLSPFMQEVEFPEQSIKDLPYDRSWVKEGFTTANYSKIYLAPVSTQYLNPDGFEQCKSTVLRSREQYDSYVEEIADYLLNKHKESLTKYKNNRFKIVETPDYETLIVEAALVNVVFSQPLTNAAVMAVPLPGSSQAFSTVSSPSISLEAKIYVGEDKELVAAMTNRLHPTLKILDLNKLTIRSSAREVADISAQVFAEALNKGKISNRKGRRVFSLLPW